MVIESSLTKELFVRLRIWRHIQRKTFYFCALTGAALAAWGYVQGPQFLMWLGWIPLLIYALPEILVIFKESRAENQPYLQSTRYEFKGKGISIRNTAGHSNLKWSHITHWQVIAGCYVLELLDGSILAIPRSALSATQRPKFEALLNKHLPR